MESEATVSRSGSVYRLANGLIEAWIQTATYPCLQSLTQKGANAEDLPLQEMPVTLRLASDAPRMDLLSWRFASGSGEPVDPEREHGFLQGFHQTHLDDGQWETTDRINHYPIGWPGYAATLYPGFGWYRACVKIPAVWRGKPIQFVLGGADCCDWRDTWVYLNGERIGMSSNRGNWHESGRYVIKTGSAAYERIRFGAANTLALQCRGLDRRRAGMVPLELERYITSSLLVDQFVAAGAADHEITSFELASARSAREGSTAAIELQMLNRAEGLRVTARYWLIAGEPSLYKRMTVENTGRRQRTLLEMDVLRLRTPAATTPGGQGQVVYIAGNWFAGVAHPAGIACGDADGVRLQVFPGRRLGSGESYASKIAVIGSGSPGRAFVEYLERHGRRQPRFLNLYSLYGLCEIAGFVEPPTEITDRLIDDNLDRLESWQRRGIKWDYYCIDTGWNNPLGDLKDFHPEHFPNGPTAALRRIAELGMKLLLWISPADGPVAFRKGVVNPRLEGSGAGANPAAPPYCLASQPWQGILWEAMIHHLRENGARGFKLDGVCLFCNQRRHGHLPGKYSIEPIIDAFLEILGVVKEACPDVLLMLYWGFTSPWWLLHADTIFERGVAMEAASPSSHPAIMLRQSVTVAQDQGHDYNWDRMPLIGQDSLGTWLSNTRWGSWMGAQGWQAAWVMDIARGSMMTQMWGDISLLKEHDVRFLAATFHWTGAHVDLLRRRPRRILGGPWRPGPYGYVYTDGRQAVVFIYNAQFAARRLVLSLKEDLQLRQGETRRPLAMRSLYAHDAEASRRTLEGAVLELRLRPFETRVVHIHPSENQNHQEYPAAALAPIVRSQRLPGRFVERQRRHVSWRDPAMRHALRMAVNGRAFYMDADGLLERSAFMADPRDRQVERRLYRGNVTLAPISNAASLFVVNQLTRVGVAWHHHALFELLKLQAQIDGQPAQARPTPRRWHEQAGGWSWITHEIPLPTDRRARRVDLALEAFLPAGVDLETSFWSVQERVVREDNLHESR